MERTLEEIPIFKYDLESKEKLAVIIISDNDDADKILKTMRSLNSNPFMIPKEFPQIPSEAYSLAELKIKELTEKQKSISKELSSITKKIRADILTMHENALVAKEVLETLRKPGGTKNFAVIQGYIPKKMEKKFKEVTSQWTSITEEVNDEDALADLPVYLDNPRWVKTFEVITSSQGIPKKRRIRSNLDDSTHVANILWINVCRPRSRIIINGIRIIIQIQRTRNFIKMGNATCNIGWGRCACWSFPRRSIWFPHATLCRI
jgi:Archaeal/vacuolar-type H+-ATPase subunit I